MKTSDVSGFEQARRVLSILKLFQKNVKLTTNEVLDLISAEYKYLSKRSTQRDLKILSDEGYIENIGHGQNSYWRQVKEKSLIAPPVIIKTEELLSFYLLKAYLKTFRGTEIEDEVNNLTEKIEFLAPGSAIIEETLYWDQNVGYYNYREKYRIISQLLHFIHEKTWLKIKYVRLSDGKEREYELLPTSLYTYSGTIYMVAYNFNAKKFINFAVHNILSIEEATNQSRKSPEFDYEKFRSERFGVIDGKVTTVRLKIHKDFVKYFEKRFWHPSQKLSHDKDGNMILKLDVPVTGDLIGFICHWEDGITVLEPDKLKYEVKKTLKAALENYE